MDRKLLESVAAESDDAETAFAELVGRHGAMVLSVCRRLLGNADEAEDAAQATFVVLWMKAGSLCNRVSVAGWLHHVARNVCRNAKRAREVRQMHEQEAARRMSSQTVNASVDFEMKSVLDEEIERLPVKYRLPIILFHLEGHTVEEVAATLNAKESTVTTWLDRGRKTLCRRISRLGIVTTAIGLSTLLSSEAEAATIPPIFISAATHHARLFAAGKLSSAGASSAIIATLTKGVLHSMTVWNIKLAATALLSASLAAGLVVVWITKPPELVADDQKPKSVVDDDARLIQGTWSLRELQQVRHEPSKEEREYWMQGKYKILIDAETVTHLADHSQTEYRLDLTKKPRVIEFWTPEGKLIARGIYELKGDHLKICQGRTSVQGEPKAPTDFDIKNAKPGEDPTLFVMTRDKPKSDRAK